MDLLTATNERLRKEQELADRKVNRLLEEMQRHPERKAEVWADAERYARWRQEVQDEMAARGLSW